MKNDHQFELPNNDSSIIKVIGVGGGGGNAVGYMCDQGIQDVEFAIANTDLQALHNNPVTHRIQLGASLTEGLGAGADPDQGRNAAEESEEEIRALLSEDTKMIFITAGMGGGTGTGAAPVISRLAREMGILTVGIVTKPFSFEGPGKTRQAEIGIEEMRENCDAMLVILNDRLLEVYPDLKISEAYSKADETLLNSAKSIAELITKPGKVNIDFADVRTVMKDAGTAVMGAGEAQGENRALRATQMALDSPLLNNTDINGAERMLLVINYGEEEEATIQEFSQITEFVKTKAGDEVDVIYGDNMDPNLGNSLRITVVATGFEQKNPDISRRRKRKAQQKPAQPDPENLRVEQNKQRKPRKQQPEHRHPTLFDQDQQHPDQAQQHYQEEEAVDHEPQQTVPTYLDDHQRLQRERDLRRQRFGSQSQPAPDARQLRDYQDRPAYRRKNIQFETPPNAENKQVSRYTLEDDNHISGDNRYLHDNVD